MSFVCNSCLKASRVLLRRSASTIHPCDLALRTGNASRRQISTIKPIVKTGRATPFAQASLRYASTNVKGDPAAASKTAPSQATSASSPVMQTVAILNPRKDPEDESKEMSIEITERAAKRLTHIIGRDSNPQLCLRVTVESGGCHGFQYLMSLTSTSDIDPDVDTIFVAQEPGEDAVEGGDSYSELGIGLPKVVMDEASLELLKDSKIDFTSELIGSQFKIVDNPRATSSCGCGTSFDVKM